MKQFENAKGCPFCGSNSVEPRSGFGIVQVKCHSCGVMFRIGAETDEQFIKKWNRRPRKHLKSTANNEQIAQRKLEQTLASLKMAMPGFIDVVKKTLNETLDHYLSTLGGMSIKGRGGEVMGNTGRVKPLAEFYQSDANYIAERIGELHVHALYHEGELCAKLNRARIGGMIEVLTRMYLEVECNWNYPDRNVLVMKDLDYLKFKEAKGAN